MKNFSKKFIKILGLTAAGSLLILTGFGCKGLSLQQQAATKPFVLEYWTVFDDVEKIQALASAYTANRKFITINVRQLRSDEIYNRFVEALADDKGPDIISVNARSLGKYIDRLQPMPPTITDTTLVETKNNFSTTVNVFSNPKAMINVIKLKSEYVQTVYKDAIRKDKVKENIYGLPLSLDVMGIYYNKDLLDRAGIPEAPKTWEEFQADVKILTKFDKASGKILQAGAAFGTGKNIPASSDLLYILFAQSKIPFVQNNFAVFDSKPQAFSGDELPSTQIMNFYTDFANPLRDTYTWNDSMPNALDSFVNGQTAFFFGYSYEFPIIKSRAPQLNFSVIPMLQLSEGAAVNTANYWLQTVTAKSKHSNEAWGFIDFIAHSPAAKQYLELTKRPTALRIYLAEQKQNPDLAPFVSQVLTAENWYQGRDFEAADKAIQTMFTEWLQPVPDDKDLAKTREEILHRAASKVNQTYIKAK
ncbi:MAG: extracellular solute-binding protein [Patescibacteria group bacterium]